MRFWTNVSTAKNWRLYFRLGFIKVIRNELVLRTQAQSGRWYDVSVVNGISVNCVLHLNQTILIENV